MNDDLSASEAASILGISLPTLYSYVSRGLLTPSAAGASRSKRYPRDAVLHLAARKADGKRGGHSAAAAMDWGVPILETRISRIADGRLHYRGHDAVALAAEATLERVAALLWSEAPCDAFGEDASGPALHVPDAAHACTVGMAPLARAAMTLHWLAQRAPSPADAADSADAADAAAPIHVQGPVLMRMLAAALLGTEPSSLPLHVQLGRAWGAAEADYDLIRAALVLLADHELNASTFAVRCVASTGACLPVALSAGLGALSGPRHGGGSASVSRLLASLRGAPQPQRIVADYFLTGDKAAPMGFRHRLYPHGDPRAACLLARLSNLPFATPDAARIVAVCVDEGRRRGHLPNADFALAAMRFALGWPEPAALILFALARSAGWIAHAAEQVQTASLIRPRARYVGRF